MGSYLSQPVTEKHSACGGAHKLVWGCSSMQGWRNHMEDAHITLSSLGGDLQNLALFGVFDGHGGAEVAAFCQERFADVLRRQIWNAGSAPLNGQFFGKVLTESFHAMDTMLALPEHERAILSLKKGAAGQSEGGSSGSNCGSAQDQSRPAKVLQVVQNSLKEQMTKAKEKGSLSREEATAIMLKFALARKLQRRAEEVVEAAPSGGPAENVGCTAVCVLLSDTEIVCANAGDSRAVLCRKGRAVDLSHDHKPNDPGERARIHAAGGRVEETNLGQSRVQYRVNGNLNLSRSLGDLQYKKRSDLGPEAQVISGTPDIVIQSLTEDDEFVVIACDGVWDVKTSQEVVDFVKDRLSARQALTVITENLLGSCLAADPKEARGIGCDNMTCIVVQFAARRSCKVVL